MKPPGDDTSNVASRKALIEGSVKQQQSVTSDWEICLELIAGVAVREVKNVLKDNGLLTEIFRTDWLGEDGMIDQVFQVVLFGGCISAWHVHLLTTDRIFVNQCQIKIVLYDARTDSSTYGRINEFRFGSARPALLVIPPGVWHGLQNLSKRASSVLNLVDRAYKYDDPDHWQAPIETESIPYSFSKDP
jgi:dTDP-4-dehydrorhamnose 3,5-epimerase